MRGGVKARRKRRCCSFGVATGGDSSMLLQQRGPMEGVRKGSIWRQTSRRTVLTERGSNGDIGDEFGAGSGASSTEVDRRTSRVVW
jgi:hypothetical protein